MQNKPYSESCVQNQAPILKVLSQVLANSEKVLEIGSGTGQHAAYFPEHLPHLHWQPSDVEAYLRGIEAWRIDANLENVAPAIILDVNQTNWPTVNVDAVFSANAVHIMSWPSVENLLAGVANLLSRSNHAARLMCLYGPFNYDGTYTSDSNANFDQWLKNRDPQSGIRHFEDMCKLASSHAMHLQDDFEMPANNRILVFRME